ncbi:ubiquitin carboxyl-terminal hydrolase 37-like [Menidia menidia]
MLSRLFCRTLKKAKNPPETDSKPSEQQQRVNSSDGASTTRAPLAEERKKETKKKRSFWRLFCCCKRKHRVSPLCDDDTQPSDEHRRSSGSHQVSCSGFPNPAQMCYMNSSIQSLLTLKDFVRDVSSQENMLRQCPEAVLARRFMEIVRCRYSEDALRKLLLLMRFKRVLSVQASEFKGPGCKDAHEFLSAVIGQIQRLASPTQTMAVSVGGNYTCPVSSSLTFQMQNTRTCKGCGAQSITVEDFCNLSLDIIPRGSVQGMLQMYQKETQLEYSCKCGGNTSDHYSRFLTLPKYLMLHLKRFKFTKDLKILKLRDPINICDELMVNSVQDEGLYSLISVINHFGSTVNDGHYVSEGLHPDEVLDGRPERWLHYDDKDVFETSRTVVRKWRQRTCYVLFYQRQSQVSKPGPEVQHELQPPESADSQRGCT